MSHASTLNRASLHGAPLVTGLLQDYAQQQAELRPEAAAIVMGPETLSYGDLAHRSSQLAHALSEGGVGPGDRVGLMLPKSPDAIVAMLAVMTIGAVYVPMDTSSPAARLARVIGAAAPRMVLATGAVGGVLDESLADVTGTTPPAVAALGPAPLEMSTTEPLFTAADVLTMPVSTLPSIGRPTDPAHLLFTSGSTGVPKGVVITHHNVTTFVDWAVRYFEMVPGDRVSGHSPLHFDLSTYDIYGAFASGATLYPVAPELNLMAPKLAAFIRDVGLTQWFSVPSILSYLATFDAVEQGDFPTLKRLLWCGEVFPTPQLRYWMERLPDVTFTNLYGPTEATIASSYQRVAERPESDSAKVPIGRACDGEELLVLDDDGQPAEVGAIGRLHIAGVGLSPGYWRDPETTARAFQAHPTRSDDRIYDTGDLASLGPDGLVYFHGRADSQIKSRGYRIELGEIETALHTIDGIADGAIVAIESSGFEGYTICCAYVPRAGSELDPPSIRRLLAEAVPSYMLPSRWSAMARLPKNANGKIDRPALRTSFRGDA